MNKKEIEENLLMIQKEVENPVDENNIIDIQKKLNKLGALMGLSAECVKDAKYVCLVKQKFVYAEVGNTGISPTMFKHYLEGQMSEELSILVYAERINAALTHCCDGLRTIISLYKQEMQLSMNQR